MIASRYELPVYSCFISSGQIIVFHQARFPWNKRISLSQLPFGVTSAEVAIIWPDNCFFFPEVGLMKPPAVFILLWKRWNSHDRYIAPETNSKRPENRPKRPKRKGYSLPTIHFWMRFDVSFKEGNLFYYTWTARILGRFGARHFHPHGIWPHEWSFGYITGPPVHDIPGLFLNGWYSDKSDPSTENEQMGPSKSRTKQLRFACLVVDLLRFGSREAGVRKFLRDYGVPHEHGPIDWICLFGGWKKFQTKFSQMVVVNDGDDWIPWDPIR